MEQDATKHLEDLPIFEPLSRATEVALRPLDLEKNDFLEIWMHENGEDLILKVISCRPAEKSAVVQSGFFAGQEEGRNPTKTTWTGDEVVESHRGCSFTARQWLSKLVERWHLGDRSVSRAGEWRVTPTDFNCLLIKECWPRERIIFRSEQAKGVFLLVIRRFLSQTIRASQQAQFKIEGNGAELPPQFRDHPDHPLAPYQKAALAFSLKQEGTALFMEQGTGKTAVSVGRVCTEARMHRRGELGDEPRMMRVLIVCPKQVRLNWLAEFEKFATVPGKVTIIRGGKPKRLGLITHGIRQEADCAFSAMIANYETVTNDAEVFEMIPWDLIILDESHYIKRSSTRRGQALIRQLRDSADRRMILTGTPIANTIMDFYGQAEFLGEGFSGFKTFSAFKKFHGRYETRGAKGFEALIGYENIPLFQERLARLSFRISKKEANLQLPDKVYDIVEVEMTPRQTELYNQIAEAIQVEISEAAGTGKMTVEHILTKLLRLAQITSGFYTTDPVRDDDGNVLKPGTTHPIVGGNPKVKELIRIIQEEDDPNCKVVVWATFVQDVKTIYEALQTAGITCGAYYGATPDAERERLVEAFNNDPEFKVLIGNPQTMAEGLNLLGYNPNVPESEQIETYCGHEVFYSTNWSSVQRSQAEDRAHRRGTRMPVRITDLTVPETIDEVIRHRVLNKREVAMQLQDIQDILQDVLGVEINLNEF